MLGVLCAVVGIFVLNGVSIEFPGIMLGGLGYYLCLTARDRAGQTIGILAAVLCAVSMGISGLEYPQPWQNSAMGLSGLEHHLQ